MGSSSSEKIGIRVINSDSLTAIYTWMDYRNNSLGLYAQRADTVGKPLWDTNDVAITLNGFSDYSTVGDGAGGLIAMWDVTASFAIIVQQVSKNGRLGELITSVNEGSTTELPKNFMLYQNYPNPFNPKVYIRFQIAGSSFVTLRIFDVLGREIATLVNEKREPGTYVVSWDADLFPSGVYFCRLRAGAFTDIKKMLFVK